MTQDHDRESMFRRLVANRIKGRYKILVTYKRTYIEQQVEMGFTLGQVLQEISDDCGVKFSPPGYHRVLREIRKPLKKEDALELPKEEATTGDIIKEERLTSYVPAFLKK